MKTVHHSPTFPIVRAYLFIAKSTIIRQYSLVNPISDYPDVWLIQTAAKNKLLNIGRDSILLCKHTQSLPSTKMFLLQEDLFVLGYF